MDKKKAAVFDGIALFFERCSTTKAAEVVRLQLPQAINDDLFVTCLRQLASCVNSHLDSIDNKVVDDSKDTNDHIDGLLRKLLQSGYCPPVEHAEPESACDTDIATPKVQGQDGIRR